jgi:hypothetical protein
MSDSTDDFLNWLCWSWGMDGDQFYPPKETAQTCMDSLPDDLYNHGEEYEHARGWEVGQHSRAVVEAQDKFRAAENHGIDPVERAAREHRELMKRADDNLPPIDWSWYDG